MEAKEEVEAVHQGRPVERPAVLHRRVRVLLGTFFHWMRARVFCYHAKVVERRVPEVVVALGVVHHRHSHRVHQADTRPLRVLLARRVRVIRASQIMGSDRHLHHQQRLTRNLVVVVHPVVPMPEELQAKDRVSLRTMGVENITVVDQQHPIQQEADHQKDFSQYP